MKMLLLISILALTGCDYGMRSEDVASAQSKCWKAGGRETYIHAGKYGDGPVNEVRCIVNGQEMKL
jgi:hypothetical protein